MSLREQPSPTANSFWASLANDLRKVAKAVSPRFATAGAVTSGLVQITERGETFDAASEPYLQLSAYPAQPGDVVAVLPKEDGSLLVLGKVQQATERSPISGSDLWQDASQLSSHITQFTPKAGIVSRITDGPTNDHAELLLGHVATANGFGGANTSSNTSTATYVDAINVTFTNLPAGTYKATAIGDLIGRHSISSGTIDLRFRGVVTGGNTVNGGAKVFSLAGAAVDIGGGLGDDLTGLVVPNNGTITVTFEYRLGTAGTINVRNARMYATVTRTGA